MESMLAAVRLHVLSKGKFLTAFGAAERLLASVQILVLMEEAAVLEGLTADVAQVRTRVVGVLATVVFHDRVVFENHATFGAFIGFEGGVTSLVVAQGHGVREGLAALLASKNALLGVRQHVLRDRNLKLEVLAAQRAVIRLFYQIAAVVVSQLVHSEEDHLALGALKSAVLRGLRLLFRSNELLLLLLVFVPVFDEAAAVLKGKAAFFAGERRELILVRVEVAVKVVRLPAGEGLSALLAHQTALFRLRCHIGALLSVRLFFIFNHILDPLYFSRLHRLLVRPHLIGCVFLLWTGVCVPLHLFSTFCNIILFWERKRKKKQKQPHKSNLAKRNKQAANKKQTAHLLLI